MRVKIESIFQIPWMTRCDMVRIIWQDQETVRSRGRGAHTICLVR